MNYMLLLEGTSGGGMQGLEMVVLAFVLVGFGPLIIMAIIGLFLLKKKKKTAKILFILATINVIISLGVCNSM